MRKPNFALIFILAIATPFSYAQRMYEILDLNTTGISIDNVWKIKGQTFGEDMEIQWVTAGQAMYARDVSDNSLYIFSKEAFESKKVKSVRSYLVKGQFSTMDSGTMGLFKAGQDKQNNGGEKRIAAVMANSNYKDKADFLRNPISDAAIVTDRLNRLGFDTYSYYDVRSDQQQDILGQFVEKAREYDVALFYFAGHGDVYREHAYYYPVDVVVDPVSHEKYCMEGSDIVEKMSYQDRKVTMLFFDACRTKSTRGHIGISLEAAPNMCIMYSTSYGDVAIDGSATLDASPFASAFCKYIGTPGMSVNDVMAQICEEVSSVSSQYQRPTFAGLSKIYRLVPVINKETVPSSGKIEEYVNGSILTELVDVQEDSVTMMLPNGNNPDAMIRVTGMHSGHEYVDLGLPSGTLWATMNVGATCPEDYGDYFAWGETSAKESYDNSWSNLKYCISGDMYSNVRFGKYVTKHRYGVVDKKSELEPMDDAARFNWNGLWRTPSLAQLDELRNECNATWVIQNGVYGCKVTSKKNGNSIFLPAAGICNGSELIEKKTGCYWSCSIDKSCCFAAMCMSLYSDSFYLSYRSRFLGLSVRPVISK